MTLREYLQIREQELLDEIEALRDQIKTLQADLIPKEGELAEVRRARAAIEPAGGIGFASSGGIGGALVRELPPSGRLPFSAPFPAPAASSGTTKPPLPVTIIYAGPADSSPYAHLTMKELVVKALAEYFDKGATTRNLLDFFRDAWGRNIERTSLSPQLSRLFQEGVIGRIRSTKGWFLVSQGGGHVFGFRPYFDRTRIFWQEPRCSSERDEPLLTRDFDGTDDRTPFSRTKIVAGGLSGALERKLQLVWLLPHEVGPDDVPAMRQGIADEE